jgi:hypothetical protein
MADQVAIGTGAVGPQAPQQFHRLQQVGLAFAVVPHHQQPRSFQGQFQPLNVAELVQLQAFQPDWTADGEGGGERLR